jgi:hypothetical protein
MPASIRRLGGGLTGSSGPTRANKFLAGRSMHKLDSLYYTTLLDIPCGDGRSFNSQDSR